MPKVFIVMEHCALGSLDDIISDDELYEVQDFHRMTWARQLACGLWFLHSKSVMHRDIKSMNVLLDKYATAKWTDFGLASRHTSSTFSKTHESTGGTKQWLPPETLDDGLYSAASEVWGYGLIVFHLGAMEEPFEGVADKRLGACIRKRKLDTSLLSSSHPVLKKVFEQCVRVEKEERPSMQDVYKLLNSREETKVPAHKFLASLMGEQDGKPLETKVCNVRL